MRGIRKTKRKVGESTIEDEAGWFYSYSVAEKETSDRVWRGLGVGV